MWLSGTLSALIKCRAFRKNEEERTKRDCVMCSRFLLYMPFPLSLSLCISHTLPSHRMSLASRVHSLPSQFPCVSQYASTCLGDGLCFEIKICLLCNVASNVSVWRNIKEGNKSDIEESANLLAAL